MQSHRRASLVGCTSPREGTQAAAQGQSARRSPTLRHARPPRAAKIVHLRRHAWCTDNALRPLLQASDWLKWGTDVTSYAKNAVQNATTLVAGSELEKKLAEATSNEPWGASGVKSPLCDTSSWNRELIRRPIVPQVRSALRSHGSPTATTTSKRCAHPGRAPRRPTTQTEQTAPSF